MNTHFDKYRDTYREEVEKSISFAGADHTFYTEVKAQTLLELTRRRVGDPAKLRALDVGCGVGETDAMLTEFGELHGVDVSAELVGRARERNPGAVYAHYDGKVLPYDDSSFDLVFAICVVHHVPPPQWRAFTQELVRVLSPRGIAAIVEHNPMNPGTRLAVARCAFDDDAVLLGRKRALGLLTGAGLEPVESRYILFFPWRGELLRRVERHLGAVPLGAQYVAAARRL